MKLPILLACIFGLAASVFGQVSPTTVNTVADLLNVVPNPQKPLVMVLGSTSANDGLGGDYIWAGASGATTNTAANGGPIAKPYGAAFGRWIKRTQYIANLRNPTLYGTVTFPSTATVTFAAGGSLTVDRVISTSDSFTEVNPQALVTKAYVDAVGLGGSTNAVVPINSMAELVAVAGTLTHGSAYYLRTYYTNDWAGGVGGGIWYWDPISDYPTNRAVIASARGGRFFPQIHGSRLDPRQFGAVTLRPASLSNQGIQDANLMMLDLTYNQGKILEFPEGVWRISQTITSPRTGTGANYVVNSGTNNPVGTTIIYASSGSGTIIAGDNIQFSTSETEPTYRVKTALSGGQFVLNAPGLQSVIASGTPIYVRPMRPPVIKGINNGIHLNPQFRGMMSSEIMMETANIPIIECRDTKHGRLEDLSLTYQFYQFANTSPNAACIYNGPNDQLLQWTIRGITMNRGSYGIHVADTAPNSNWPCANNRFDDILVRYASAQAIRMGKSGTINNLGWWYIQNAGYSLIDGADGGAPRVSFSAASKSGTTVTMTLAATPGCLNVGTFIEPEFSNDNLNGQQFVKTWNPGTRVLTFDVDPSQSATPLPATNGTAFFLTVSSSAEPLVYFSPQFIFDGQSIDIEANSGTTTPGQPVLFDNDGVGHFGTLHMEYGLVLAEDQALLRNGGTLTIGTAMVINQGRLDSANGYIFENNTTLQQVSNPKGSLRIENLVVRDFSNMSTGGAIWRVQVTNNAAPPVVIGKKTELFTNRQNATSVIDSSGAQTPSLIALP
jgi:hypothetical protein